MYTWSRSTSNSLTIYVAILLCLPLPSPLEFIRTFVCCFPMLVVSRFCGGDFVKMGEKKRKIKVKRHIRPKREGEQEEENYANISTHIYRFFSACLTHFLCRKSACFSLSLRKCSVVGHGHDVDFEWWEMKKQQKERRARRRRENIAFSNFHPELWSIVDVGVACVEDLIGKWTAWWRKRPIESWTWSDFPSLLRFHFVSITSKAIWIWLRRQTKASR